MLAGWGAVPPAGSAAEREAAKAAPSAGYGGLPEGPGQVAAYFSCTACHSLKPLVRQRLSRDEWDKLLARKVANDKMHPMAPWARRRVLNYLATHFGVDEEDWQGLPAGLGREEVFYSCQACHSLAIVKQQGLNRESWDESLVWMVEEQEMDPLDAEDRKLVLDYLTAHYGRKSSKRRRQIR